MLKQEFHLIAHSSFFSLISTCARLLFSSSDATTLWLKWPTSLRAAPISLSTALMESLALRQWWMQRAEQCKLCQPRFHFKIARESSILAAWSWMTAVTFFVRAKFLVTFLVRAKFFCYLSQFLRNSLACVALWETLHLQNTCKELPLCSELMCCNCDVYLGCFARPDIGRQHNQKSCLNLLTK